MTSGAAARLARAGAWAAVVGLTALMGGCRDALFTNRDERSQFARYDAVRDQVVPPFIEDEFGRRRPNLRGRLLSVK